MAYWYAIGPVAQSTDAVDGTFYHAPDKCISWIDTRPITPGSVASGFFAFSERPDHLKETHAIIGDGSRLEEYYPNATERSAWEAAFGVKCDPALTLVQTLRQLLFVDADPEGALRCLPGTPTHRGVLELHLGGHSRVWAERFTGRDHDAWPVLQRLQKANMARLIAEQEAEAARIRAAKPTDDLGRRITEIVSKRGGKASYADVREELAKAAEALPGKALTNVCRKYRCEPHDVLPRDVEVERRKPETALSDDFNRATLGANWTSQLGTWRTYDSTEVENSGSTGSSVMTHATQLSSDDHYVQIKCTYRTTAKGHWTGPLCRAAASSTRTHYEGRVRTDTGFSRGIVKCVSDSFTNIAVYGADCLDKTVRLVCDGSSQTLYVDGSEVASSTDSAISGSVYVGVTTHPTAWSCRGDDFSAEDLLAAAVIIPVPLLMLRA